MITITSRPDHKREVLARLEDLRAILYLVEAQGFADIQLALVNSLVALHLLVEREL